MRRCGARALGRWVMPIVLFSACASPQVRTVVVRDARAFEARQGATGAAYGTIINGSDSAEALDSVTSPRSRFVSAHAQRETNGYVTMTPLEHPSIAAHDSVVFSPGGDHLMLEALDRDLKAGDQVPLTFWFHRTGPIRVTATVTPYGS